MNFPFALLLALAATLTLASPVPKKFLGLFDIPTTFIKYQAPKPVGVDKIVKVDCMGQQLSEQAVKTSFTYLTGYANMQAKRPKDEKTGTVYPNQIDPTTSDNSKVLEALTQWKGCEPYQKFTAYVEFPVNADETGYKGGDAGSDKIIALAQENMVPYSKMTYCGVFSNRQQDGKVFAPCKPSA